MLKFLTRQPAKIRKSAQVWILRKSVILEEYNRVWGPTLIFRAMKRFINACIKPALLVPAVFLLTVLGGNAEAQEYTCDFADAPFNSTQNPPAGQVSATYGARTFSLQGKESKA